MPARVARLPRDRGYPVPWFVAWINGKPDFRVIGPGKINQAYLTGSCWICGSSLGRYPAYVVGPMCAVNRTSAEPPSHRDCAIFAARACPFLARPRAKRRENLPDGTTEPAGVMLKRNPGVAMVWVTKTTKLKNTPGHLLFDLGDPVEVLWFAYGREATRAEVEASMESGLPLLREAAAQDGKATSLAHASECAKRSVRRSLRRSR